MASWKEPSGRVLVRWAGQTNNRQRLWQGPRCEMRFHIDVRTLDGKLSYEREDAADALAVAEGGKESLGVTITDTEEGKTYSPEEFRKRFGH